MMCLVREARHTGEWLHIYPGIEDVLTELDEPPDGACIANLASEAAAWLVTPLGAAGARGRRRSTARVCSGTDRASARPHSREQHRKETQPLEHAWEITTANRMCARCVEIMDSWQALRSRPGSATTAAT